MDTLVPVISTLIGLCAIGFPARSALLRLRVPAAVSLLALGLLLGEAGLGLLPAAWMRLAPVLSKAAFVVLLLRAGLGLPSAALRVVLVPALLLGAIPAAVELAAVAGLSRALLFDRLDASLLAGFLIAAVSPAVILPAMLQQKDLGRGAARLVPDRIMGMAVVNAFIAQLGILVLVDVIAPTADGNGIAGALAWLPLALVGGMVLGSLAGRTLGPLPLRSKGPLPASRRRVRVAAWSFTAVAFGVYFGAGALSLESVAATLAFGRLLRRGVGSAEQDLRAELKRVWSVAEIVLFVNLGSQIQLARLTDAGLVVPFLAILVVSIAVRVVAARAILARTCLTVGERTYSLVAQLPKATIQAVYAAYPLAIFLERRAGDATLVAMGGDLVVMGALAILATAPLGAVLLDRLGARLLRAPDAAAPTATALREAA